MFDYRQVREYLPAIDCTLYPKPFLVSRTQFRHWSRQGFYDLEQTSPQWGRSRSIISFGELLTVRTIAALRSRGIPLRQIREAHEYLVEATADSHPFATRPILTDIARFPKHVYSTVDGLPVAANLSGQRFFDEMREVQRLDTTRIEYAEGDDHAIWWEVSKGVAIDPLRHGGEPCVLGTRVPTTVLWTFHNDGMTNAEIADDFELEENQVVSAIAWQKRLAAVAA